MRPNANLTIYHSDVHPTTRAEVWTRTQITGVTWEDRKAANVIKSGLLEADRVAVYIPFTVLGSIDPERPVVVGDVIVRGLVSDVISESFTITALKARYPDSVVVRSVDRMDRGSMFIRHFQIGAS